MRLCSLFFALFGSFTHLASRHAKFLKRASRVAKRAFTSDQKRPMEVVVVNHAPTCLPIPQAGGGMCALQALDANASSLDEELDALTKDL